MVGYICYVAKETPEFTPGNKARLKKTKPARTLIPKKGEVKIMMTGGMDTPAPKNQKELRPEDLRKWQVEAFNALQSKRLRRVVGPTGSGKSTAMIALGLADYKAGYKVVVAYPQNTIAPGFLPKKGQSEKLVNVPGHGILAWNPTRPGFDQKSTVGNEVCKNIREFLAGPGKEPRAMQMLCSHSGLTAVSKALVNTKKKVSLIIDEAHRHHFDTDEEGEDQHNGLGSITSKLLNNKNVRITLATATYMRNEGGILPQDRQKDFANYTLPVYEYLESLQTLREIRVGYAVGEQLEALKAVMKTDNTRKTIVFFPLGMDPEKEKPQLVAAVKRALGKVGIVSAEIVDLVTTEGRPARCKALLDEIEKEKDYDHPEIQATAKTPTVVLALNYFKEGTDWPACSQAILLSPRGSMVENIQMMGRVWRDHPTKPSADFITILSNHSNDEDEIRQQIKSVCVSLVAEWAFKASKIKSLAGRGKKKLSPAHKAAMDIAEDYGEGAELEEAMRVAKCSKGATEASVDAALKERIVEMVEEAGHTGAFADQVVKALTKHMHRMVKESSDKARAGRLKGVDLPSLDSVDMEPDLSKSKYGVFDALTYGITGKTLRAWAGALGSDRDPEAKKREIKEFYAKNGRLPGRTNPKETRLNGRLSQYCSKTGKMYDEVFEGWARSVGYGEDTAAVRKNQIRDFFRSSKRLPKYSSKDLYEKKLGGSLGSYCSPSGDSYDPDFDKWARRAGYGFVPSEERKQKIRKFFVVGGRFPSKRSKNADEITLGNLLSAYCSKSSESYDPVFDKWARTNGFARNTQLIAQDKIRKFVDTNKRLPRQQDVDADERKMSQALQRICSKNSSRDSEFIEWARRLGYGVDTKKANQDSIKRFRSKHGEFPKVKSDDLEESFLGKCLGWYCCTKGTSFDAKFRKWAVANGYARDTATVKKSEIKRIFYKTGRFPASDSKLYRNLACYCSDISTNRAFDPDFNKWARSKGYGKYGSRSGHKGIKRTSSGRWAASIYEASQCLYLGNFPTKAAAIKARKAAEKKYGK